MNICVYICKKDNFARYLTHSPSLTLLLSHLLSLSLSQTLCISVSHTIFVSLTYSLTLSLCLSLSLLYFFLVVITVGLLGCMVCTWTYVVKMGRFLCGKRLLLISWSMTVNGIDTNCRYCRLRTYSSLFTNGLSSYFKKSLGWNSYPRLQSRL